MFKLVEECKVERRIINYIRTMFNKKFEYRELTDKIVAEKLGLAEIGASFVRKRCDWSVKDALRIGEALGIIT